MKTIVIARFDEGLHWTNQLSNDFKVEVVQKGVDLEDYGREASSFCWYIIKHYEELEGSYVFCQGAPYHHSINFVDRVNRADYSQDYFEFGDHEHIDQRVSSYHSDPKVLNGEVYEKLFGNPSPKVFGFKAGGGQFMVSTKNIKKHPKEFYEKALQICKDYPMAPWAFERLWRTIFGSTD